MERKRREKNWRRRGRGGADNEWRNVVVAADQVEVQPGVVAAVVTVSGARYDLHAEGVPLGAVEGRAVDGDGGVRPLHDAGEVLDPPDGGGARRLRQRHVVHKHATRRGRGPAPHRLERVAELHRRRHGHVSDLPGVVGVGWRKREGSL